MREPRNVRSLYQRRQIEKLVPENVVKLKETVDIKKTVTRKALADKTNSTLGEIQAMLPKIKSKSPGKKPNEGIENISPVKSERPRRAHRLPSKYVDHTLTPQKSDRYVDRSSTPLAATEKNTKRAENTKKPKTVTENEAPIVKKVERAKRLAKKVSDAIELEEVKPDIPHVGGNRPDPVTEMVANVSRNILERKNSSSVNKSPAKVKKRSNAELNENQDKLAVYDFEFDPAEEPPPAKKKKIRKKRPAKPKNTGMYIFKDNYARNIQKKVNSLKEILSSKSEKQKAPIGNSEKNAKSQNKLANDHTVATSVQKDNNIKPLKTVGFLPEGDRNTNYEEAQPENIPPPTKNQANKAISRPNACLTSVDLSIASDFDEEPIASSTFSTSHLNKSHPWRVDVAVKRGKWPTDFYVKPNLTPGFDSTFHDNNEPSPDYSPVQSEPRVDRTPDKSSAVNKASEVEDKFKQTSILSFFDEVTRSKSKARTPRKSDTPKHEAGGLLFQDALPENLVNIRKVTKAIFTPTKDKSRECNNNQGQLENVSSEDENDACSAENNDPVTPLKNILNTTNRNSAHQSSTKKGSSSKSDKYFGFDDDSDEDQENIAPTVSKASIAKKRGIFRAKRRTALGELNNRTGPMRVHLPSTSTRRTRRQMDIEAKASQPAAVQSGDSDSLDNIIMERDPTENVNLSSESTTPEQREENQPSAIEQEVPLFEDVGLKPLNRRSYGRASRTVKRVRIASQGSEASSDADDHDNTFTIPRVTERKKRTKKRKVDMNRKEQLQAKVWAEQFNSMLEEVDDFSLCVE